MVDDYYYIKIVYSESHVKKSHFIMRIIKSIDLRLIYVMF